MPPIFSLLTANGQILEDPSAAHLRGDFPHCVAGHNISGVRIALGAAQAVRAVRVTVLATTETMTWDSWARPPRVPAPGTLALHPVGGAALPCREARALRRSHDDLPFPDCAAIELTLTEPPTLDALELRFAPGPYLLLRIEVNPQGALHGEPVGAPVARERPAYPEDRRALPYGGDPLGDALLQTGEPTLQGAWQRALPFSGTALLGIVEGPMVGAAWDGGLVFAAAKPDPDQPGGTARDYVKLDLGPLSGGLAVTSQRLHKGFLPIHEVRAQADGLRLLQTSFVDLSGRLRVRWLVENTGTLTATLRPRLVAVRSRKILADGPTLPDPAVPLRVCRGSHHAPLPVSLTARGDGFDIDVGDRQGRLTPNRPLTLPPGVLAAIELELPLRPPTIDTGTFEQALHGTTSFWETYLSTSAQLDLPEPLFQDLWRALHIHNRLFQSEGKMRYGAFPGVYQGDIFGVEEGWNLVALAMLGQGELAQRLLATTFFEPEFLEKKGQHHQYRNGLCTLYALDVYHLTGDLESLKSLWPTIKSSGRWIAESLHSTRKLDDKGERPAHYGLMPRHTYGGDLSTPAYSLYGSSACWRGLRDAGIVGRLCGDKAEGDALLREAHAAREDMHKAADRIFKHDGNPPFLPFQVDEPGDKPQANDYHQLFASLILETALFGWQGRHSKSISDYLQQTGRLVMGIARFDQWFGRLGIDAEYSRGVQLARLCRRDFDGYWLGVIGQIGLSCDPATFTSPETTIVRFTAQDHQERLRMLAHDPRRLDSDPCSAGTAVMIQYLRYALCFEEHDEDDLPTHALWLAPAAPRSWFAAGRRFGFRDLPTSCGQASLEVVSGADEVRFHVTLARPTLCELFYFDREGHRRSERRGLGAGQTEVVLPR